MKFTIVHICTRAFPYGARSMLNELHYAIKTHFPEHQQETIIFKQRTMVNNFGADAYSISLDELLERLPTYENPIVVAHHISMTDMRKQVAKIYGKYPIILLNHTQKKTFNNMPLFIKIFVIFIWMFPIDFRRYNRSAILLFQLYANFG